MHHHKITLIFSAPHTHTLTYPFHVSFTSHTPHTLTTSHPSIHPHPLSPVILSTFALPLPTLYTLSCSTSHIPHTHISPFLALHPLTLTSPSPHTLTFSPPALHTLNSHSTLTTHSPQLVSYAALRNLSSLLQCYTSSLLSQLGFTSLWLFVSSHHILLALNGSALLLLFPNKSHLLNFILVLSVFLCAHVVVTTAVNTIRQYRPCGHKSPVTS